MSPNKNYVQGRNFEYKRRKHYEHEKYHVIRASGSHGKFDLIALDGARPTLAIQCKRVTTEGEADALLEKFRCDPPLTPSKYIKQILDVYVKQTRTTVSTVI